jgi:hypothetical protein
VDTLGLAQAASKANKTEFCAMVTRRITQGASLFDILHLSAHKC